MPEGSWDWSISVPLSQGWKIGDRVFVGGQISADKQGHSVGVGDLAEQTRNIYKFIGSVLHDAGASMDDIVRLKVCYKYDSKEQSGQNFCDKIIDLTHEFFEQPGPALTAFGVDLLYPGLDLEIDAMAIVGHKRRALKSRELGGRYQPDLFADGVGVADDTYVAGQVALGSDNSILCKGDAYGQAVIVFKRLAKVLAYDQLSMDDIVKLNIFIVGDGVDVEEEFNAILLAWAESAPHAHPAMTPVRVHELPQPGLLVQADCVALK